MIGNVIQIAVEGEKPFLHGPRPIGEQAIWHQLQVELNGRQIVPSLNLIPETAVHPAKMRLRGHPRVSTAVRVAVATIRFDFNHVTKNDSYIGALFLRQRDETDLAKITIAPRRGFAGDLGDELTQSRNEFQLVVADKQIDWAGARIFSVIDGKDSGRDTADFQGKKLFGEFLGNGLADHEQLAIGNIIIFENFFKFVRIADQIVAFPKLQASLFQRLWVVFL